MNEFAMQNEGAKPTYQFRELPAARLGNCNASPFGKGEGKAMVRVVRGCGRRLGGFRILLNGMFG